MREQGAYYSIRRANNYKKRYKKHWKVDYDIDQAKVCIFKFKENFRDICNTETYQRLKEVYRPRVIYLFRDKRGRLVKDKDENYIQESIQLIQNDLPKLDDFRPPLGLFRQVYLTDPKDRVSIHNFIIHVETIGDDSSTQLYYYLKEKLELYLNAITGIHYRWSSREEKTIEELQYRIIDWFDQLNYGGPKWHHDSLLRPVEIGDSGSIYKITEYFLGCMVLLCRIGMIFRFKDFDEDEICKNHCPFRIYYGKESPFCNYSDCKALPISPNNYFPK
jgi:hypothetical protein